MAPKTLHEKKIMHKEFRGQWKEEPNKDLRAQAYFGVPLIEGMYVDKDLGLRTTRGWRECRWVFTPHHQTHTVLQVELAIAEIKGEKERERQRDRDRERQGERERDRERYKEKETERFVMWQPTLQMNVHCLTTMGALQALTPANNFQHSMRAS